MKFMVEDEYPQRWISGNEPIPPFPECERRPWKINYGDGITKEGADYLLEISSLEELIELGIKKRRNIFINVLEQSQPFVSSQKPPEWIGPRIVFTTNDEPE